VNRQLIKDSKTGEPFEGVSFELPTAIPPLLCDKPQCISQGTFLSGGTRFTVALRGDNQLLKDYRLGVISDASGKEITVNPITIQGRTGIAYTADFTGATVSNIRFTKIRGVMLPITDTLSFELNHFALIGTNADFDADEILFNNILSSIAFHNDEYSVETRSLDD
jgi:hypothetical protein